MPAAADTRTVLIVALSGRALAASARRAGWRPMVLDAFGDLDTRETACATRRVPLDPDWRFVRDRLLQAAAELAPPSVPLVYGAGFERDPQLLAALARGRELLGTKPEAVARAKDPRHFARACRELAIPHPEIRFSPPPDPHNWVEKRAGGAGGGHVRPAAADRPLAPGRYLQRRVPGRPVSCLVLGDGTSARVVGFARQWHASGRGFRFSGTSVPAKLSETLAAALAQAACRLASAFAVRGLASVDAMLLRDRFWVLELNPRPTAALEPLELAAGCALFDHHVTAARGDSLPLPPLGRGAANEVLFTPVAIDIPDGFRWPAWAGDRTPHGTTVAAGGPVCTVRALAASAAMARAAARRRARGLLLRLLALAGDAARVEVRG